MNNTTSANCKLFEAYLKYGIRKSQAHFTSLNYFSIPEELKDIFPTYFIEHWSTKTFLASIKEGSITLNGTEYILVYRRGASRGKILKREQVSLSFRQAAPEFGLSAYVLVA